MRAAVGSPDGVKVTEVDVAGGAGELIEVHAVSICASDLKYLHRGTTQILGHEIAGVKADGTAVVAEATFGCGTCEWCLRGERNLCRVARTDIVGMTTPGGMAEYFRAPAYALIAIPQGLPVANASLVEPGAVAWHACRKAAIGPDTSVAVVGAGAIGILAVLAARRMGAAEVALESRYGYQREMGERFGAVEPTGLYDVVIEASGSPSGLARSIELLRPKGVIPSVAVYDPDIKWPYRDLFFKEAAVIPAIAYSNDETDRDFEHAAALLADDPGIASALITHRLGLDDAPEAFEIAETRPPGTFKIVVDIRT